MHVLACMYVYMCKCMLICVYTCLQACVRHGGSVVGFGALRPEGCRFEPHSSRQVETLGKSFTNSCFRRVNSDTVSILLCSRERL